MARGLSMIAILPIRAYQRWISPLLPPRCKYYPTCSSYALTCLSRHGLVKGTILTLWRLARCNPWSMGGIDRPPLSGEWRAEPFEKMSEDELAAYWRELDSEGHDVQSARAAA